MQIIDSHQHFWKFDPGEYDWIDDSMSILKQDYLPQDLEIIYKENTIQGCVTVQASSTETETHRMLDFAENNDFIKGVVGWVNLIDKNAYERLAVFKENPKFKGVRHVLQSEEPGYMENAEFLKGLSHLHSLNLTYDLLIYPKHLFTAHQLIQKLPEQKFVIDHLAKPFIKSQQFTNWKDLLQNFRDHKNVYCKISGMVTEADWKNWRYKDFIPVLEVVTDVFGPDRLMYGSDWPVCLCAASYKNVLDIVKTFTNNWTASEKEKIFSKNAISFYNLVV